MESEPPSLQVLGAMFDKKKKKKRRKQLDSMEGDNSDPPAPGGLGDPALAGEPPQEATRKKRKEARPLSPSLPEAELGPEAAGPTSGPPHKKRRRSALALDEETGVMYVLVDREDSEKVPRKLRRDVDVVYVDVSQAQRAALEPEAWAPPGSPPPREPEELCPRAKKKKKKRHRDRVPDSPPPAPQYSDGVPGSPQHAPQDSDGVPGSPQHAPQYSDGVPSSPQHASQDRDRVPDSPQHDIPQESGGVPESPQGTPRHAIWGEVWESPRTPTPLQLRECCVPETPPVPQPGQGDRKKAKKKKKALLGSPDSEVPAPAPPEPTGCVSREDEPEACMEEARGHGAELGRKKKTKKRKSRAPGSEVGGSAPQGNCSTGHPPSESEGDPRTKGVECAGSEPAQENPDTLEKPPRSPLPDGKGSLSAGSQDSGDSDVDLGAAVRQLQEFIPSIKDRAATTIRRMYRDDLGRFREFKAQGVAIKFGKFSVKENKQLEQNVRDFLALTGIESADKLLYTDRYPEEKSAITDLKRKYSFRMHIGKGIARPWKLVYYRAKKMFDVNNYKGRYSPGEEEKLKAYHSLHGNDWKKIGEMVARSSLSVALKYSQISSARNRGAWSKAETQRLTKAVEEVILKKMSAEELQEVDAKLRESPERRLSIVREKLYKGISWVEVEARVETRNWMQCKSKWMEILTRRMTKGQRVYRGVNALQAKVNLIERLYEINVEDANEIDWEDLASTIGDVPPSYVQTKFYKLKATCVPLWQKKMFPEIIDHLYEVTLPLLKEKLEKVLEKRGAEVQPPAAPRQAFLFRDIFCTEDSEDEAESERS